MTNGIEVHVLKSVRVADPGSVHGRQIIKGVDDVVPTDVFDDLEKEGYVEKIGAKRKGKATLRDDGPTIAEFIAAGYPASKYPPEGYASRSTPDEIEAAMKAEDAAKALEAMRAELSKMTNAQLVELAGIEEIAVETDDNKAALVDKIMAGRAAKAS